ncbi:MAG: TerB family tellurite resistance protein, partial [Myxococcota bacterium]|nr:TerB family tellurite resistance protein [Myxococcota bacterium]
MALLANVARADGDVAEAEVAVIRKVALQMGLPPSDWDEVAASLQLTSSQAQLTEALMVPGQPLGTTLAQAKPAFRSIVLHYQPDKYTNRQVHQPTSTPTDKYTNRQVHQPTSTP